MDDDTPDMIRQQMEETKSQLSDKLESLEQQVSETVQSTGTAVNATVEAVHDTVESVTGAVQEAVQFITHALDIRRQVERNPFIAIGGAFVLGYLAVGFLKGRTKPPNDRATTGSVPYPPSNGDGTASTPAATAAAMAAAYESGRNSSSWILLREQALTSAIDVVRTIATQAAPQIIELFKGTQPEVTRRPEVADGPRDFQRPMEVPVGARRLQIGTSDNTHSRNSF